jgi:hypothetical protein
MAFIGQIWHFFAALQRKRQEYAIDVAKKTGTYIYLITINKWLACI